MIKKLFVCILVCVAFTTVMADEGMWLPSRIKERVKEMRSLGFKLKADDIYSDTKASLKDAVMQFGGGCTGEFISPEGLLLTNHHCGYSSIQKLSSVEHDYLTYGYWAKSKSEELPVPGLTITLLVRMEDITDRVAAGETNASIVAEAEENGRYTAQINSMYYGLQQYLFVYQVFKDVRLVGAPPSSIGKFGGDTDNWIWPRHTGDFSIFRVYANADNEPAEYSADNVPYRPKRFFEISTKGVEEGDFTMIYGFPGNTQEYVTSDAVEYVANVANPMKIELRTKRLEIISEAQAKDAAVRIAYAAKHASIANSWKKWQGESLGLSRLNTIEKKQDYENYFSMWAQSQPQYAHILDSLRVAYKRVAPGYFVRELFNESIGSIEAYNYTVNLANGAAMVDAGTITAGNLLNWRVNFMKDYNVSIDKAIAQYLIDEFIARAPKDIIPSELLAAIDNCGTTEAFVDSIYSNTHLLTAEPLSSVDIQNDIMTTFVGWFNNVVKNNRKYVYRNISNVPEIENWYRPYMQALREWDSNRAFYPDANFTLRVSYGTVTGYENVDGEYHTHLTTLDGIIAKDNPEIYDYNIPQELRDIHSRGDYGRWGVKVNGRTTVPVCFLASNHTSGGNSGSPVINGRGELIGINFDRTWRSTMSDIEFDPTICRNISVDIRYVLFVIDRIGKAGYLLNEMNLK
ncbi:MAG: S46 family peptidase [Bacteroidaceae bacterium]|nr:S46 family peptidase [Bacteroidaceae bacterium]